MISIERQRKLFEGMLDSLNAIEMRVPELNLPIPIMDMDCKDSQEHPIFKKNKQSNVKLDEIMVSNIKSQEFEHYPEKEINAHIFDYLGYFNPSNPSYVYLCKEKINNTIVWWEFQLKGDSNYLKFVNEVHWLVKEAKRLCNILAEVIYLHECAHYIHFHTNKFDYLSWDANDRNNYVETFAQLLTDRMVKKSTITDELHCAVFKKLQRNQSSEYTIFNSQNLHIYPEYIIYKVFLTPYSEATTKNIISDTKLQFQTYINNQIETTALKDLVKYKYYKLQSALEGVGQIDDKDWIRMYNAPSWSEDQCNCRDLFLEQPL